MAHPSPPTPDLSIASFRPPSPPSLSLSIASLKPSTTTITTTTTHLSPYEKSDLQLSATSLLPSSPSPIVISEFSPGWRFHLAFTSLMAITLAAALDTTSVSVALPSIAHALNGSAIEAFWSGTAFFLTSTIFQLNFASFSHIFGRKNMLMIAIAFFGVGAVMAASANGFSLLLAGRAIQGVGAGGVNALTDIIVTDLVPLRQRGKWLGILNSMWAVGSVGGPMMGGVFVQEVSWRWIFWINLPICVVGTVLMAFSLQLHFHGTSFGAQLKRVDWIGSLLFIISAISFLIPITLGGVILPWTSWALLVPLLVGAAGLIGFVFYEVHIPAEPLVRFSIFRTRTASVTYFQTFLHALIVYSVLYYLPLYYEAVKHLSPVLTGVAMFPETFTVAPASIVSGILISVWGRYKWAMWSGWVLTVLGSGLLQFLDVHTPTAVWISVNVVLGLGTGLIFQPVNMAIQSSVDTADVAFAVAFASFLECFGEAIGIATCGVIFQNRLRALLLSSPMLSKAVAVEYSRDATSLVRIINVMHPDSLKRNFLIQSYASSLKTVWLAMTILASVALLSTFLITNNSLDVELKTEQGFQHDEKQPDSELVSTNETAG